MRWKFGVSMGPPNVLLAPNPTSSVRISRIFGAPAGASTPFGKSGLESFTVRPIFPLKGASGFGNGSPFDGVPSAESLAAIAVSPRSEPQRAILQRLRITLHRPKV